MNINPAVVKLCNQSLFRTTRPLYHFMHMRTFLRKMENALETRKQSIMNQHFVDTLAYGSFGAMH